MSLEQAPKKNPRSISTEEQLDYLAAEPWGSEHKEHYFIVAMKEERFSVIVTRLVWGNGSLRPLSDQGYDWIDYSS